MRIPKWFERWFNSYGIGTDYMPDSYHYILIRRIAWRAYHKGKKEGRAISNEQLASAEHKGNMNGFKRGRRYEMENV